MTQLSKYPLKVFYDGRCGICRTAVNNAKISGSGGKLTFIDISAPGFKAERFHLNAEAIQQSLHVVDDAGRLYMGIDAVREFRITAGCGRLEQMIWWISLQPVCRSICATIYRWLADHRHGISHICRL